ncbi:hypothetical protein N7466_001779 [Penicillium verhagenii]|uniref:uncharacterized protein n=1 Tax=Penicillium verhagenii TaxID=1562060 RepID=UPI002544D2E6|nr:uncharacterized protein N7466_001779 [Penicillium verhagenii]KAJ5938645.1 hypothetical protein N7466_001779 [Penicillium verhagenii]
MYNPYQPPPGAYGRPQEYGAYPGAPGAPPGMAPPPGMAAPGTAPPANMLQANSQQPGRPGGFPANFQPPPNMPNINFSAPVIRLGTSGPAKPAGPEMGRERGAEGPGRRAGLGSSSENQRHHGRDSTMQPQPPTRDEIVRTLFVGGITEGAGGDDGIERILQSAGRLRRWIRALDADEKPCRFGFAEFDDPESLETAVEVLQEIEVPVKRQVPRAEGEEEKEVEKSTLLVVVDESTTKYLDQFKESRGDRDPEEINARFEAARGELKNVLTGLFHPTDSTTKEGASAVDREGDLEMQDGDTPKDGEVVTIPITVEDELADIPPEMRANVAKEIAAFRERSNRRDIERLKREEEIESMERARNAGSRFSRLASPPASAPSGPAGGANGIPLGPRDRGVPNAPAGPKGFGVQIPKDYQKGVSFVNGGTNGYQAYGSREDEDSDASDEELERRRQSKRDAEQEKQFLDQERRWLNRERSRTAALEREKKRDKEDDGKLQAAHDEMDERMKAWNDDTEASRKTAEYYADRGAWLRSRAAFRSREANLDDADRAAEERERAQSAKKQEQARGAADDFLARQAQELETRTQEPPREPQRFKLSLGAAAQKAQAATTRRTAAEVEGLLEDEEEPATTARRPLIPIKFDTAAEAAGLSDEERAQAARQLAAEIPTDKEGLWKWTVKWEFVDEAVLSDQIKPFVEKKIVEYLGVQEQMLVDVVEGHIRQKGSPQELVDQLAEALDEEAEVLVRKLWRMLIFFSESEKRGLSA